MDMIFTHSFVTFSVFNVAKVDSGFFIFDTKRIFVQRWIVIKSYMRSVMQWRQFMMRWWRLMNRRRWFVVFWWMIMGFEWMMRFWYRFMMNRWMIMRFWWRCMRFWWRYMRFW